MVRLCYFIVALTFLFFSISTLALAAEDKPAAKSTAPAVSGNEEADKPTVPPPTFYGFLRLQTWYNDSAVTNIDAPLWVIPEAKVATPRNANGDLGLSARESRLGLKWSFDALGGTFAAKLEMDFWGGFANSLRAANQPNFRLRVASIDMAWKHFHFKIGNDWSIASPVNPPTINFIIMGGKGNLWMRTPYINVGMNIPFAEDGPSLHIDIAAARAESGDGGGIGPRDSYLDGAGLGEIMKLPHLHYRVAFKYQKLLELGVSGIFGVEDAVGSDPTLYTLTNEYLPSYFVSGELKLNIKMLSLSGEFFRAANVDQFLGSLITQDSYYSQNTGTMEETQEARPSMGGWLSLGLKIEPASLAINIGGGFEKILDTSGLTFSTGLPGIDYSFANGAEMQWNIFGNVWYNIFPQFKLGLEAQYIRAMMTWDDPDATDFAPTDVFRLAFCSHFSF
jgi:hypothetical protein